MLPILLFPLVVLLLIIVKVKSTTVHVLSRVREFDALVCYKFDTDNDYVINEIMNSLEQICEPPLELCVHERDFVPGLYIKDNIKNAIKQSNTLSCLRPSLIVIGVKRSLLIAIWKT